MAWGDALAESVEMLKVAWPELFKVPEPRLVLPSKNATDPVGIPPLPLTVAVKVTTLPTDAGFSVEVSSVALMMELLDDAFEYRRSFIEEEALDDRARAAGGGICRQRDVASEQELKNM